MVEILTLLRFWALRKLVKLLGLRLCSLSSIEVLKLPCEADEAADF